MQACVATANMESEEPKNFPLHITIAEGGIKQVPQEFSAEFVVGILPRIDWRALRATAAELGIAALPEALPESYATDVGFLKSVHTLILEVHVTEGALVCGNCQRVYPIVKGIPNMLLNEDEV